MKFLSIILATAIGVILAVLIIVLVIIFKINKSFGKSGLNSLKNAIHSVKSAKLREYSRVKDVSGMTTLLEPSILRDFPQFNKDLIYAKVESNLRKIFNAIENKSISGIVDDDDLFLLKSTLIEKIEDLKGLDTEISYDEVQFHRHSIKNYNKSDGIATVTISSSLEYYYSAKGANVKSDKELEKVKKQTRYTTEFVYIYDETKFEKNESIFGLSCPNCGAPLKRLDLGSCEYCSAHLEPINLKIWKMSSYKEDYE